MFPEYIENAFHGENVWPFTLKAYYYSAILRKYPVKYFKDKRHRMQFTLSFEGNTPNLYIGIYTYTEIKQNRQNIHTGKTGRRVYSGILGIILANFL